MKVGVATIVTMQAALGLYLGLPGQLSSDSVVQLYEGRTLHFISFHPPLMSLLLGVLDRLGSAPVGFVLLSQALLSAATWLVLSKAGRPTALQLCCAAIVLLNPVVLCYVGIVWKDVLLAHAVVFAYLLIAWLRQYRKPLTPSLAALVVLLLTVIVGARQQGLLFACPAALWAATLVRSSRRARLLAGIAFLALPVAANRLMEAYVGHARADAQLDAVATGFRILALFDIAGILANGGALPAGTSPNIADELRRQSLDYSPYRVDTITGPGRVYWALDSAEAMRLWRAAIPSNPVAYLRHRAEHFSTLLGLADMRRCIPIFSGVSGPPPQMTDGVDLAATLGLSVGPNRTSDSVNRFGWKWANTPLFMHVAYGAVLVPISIWLIRRRDYVLLTLATCALLFLASYLVVGIACDFRYAYTLTVTTTLLAAYACASPRPSRVTPRPGQGTIGA